MTTDTQPNLDTLVVLFRALAQESRLRLVGLLAERPRTVEELAQATQLSASTVSHHLTKLKEVGLVDSERDQYYQVYRFVPERMHDLSRLLSQRTPVAVEPVQDPLAEAEAYRREVLSNFLVEGRLVKIPAQRKKREVVLEFLAEQFEPGRKYTEKEVNAVIQRYHEDFCTLRRELIMGGKYMTRDAGIYERA
jgi:biotin operon repressor